MTDLNELSSQIASIIKESRKEAGMSQSELARAVGLTQSVISKMETAEYNCYELSTLFKIFDIMNIDVDISFTPREQISDIESDTMEKQEISND